MKRMFELPSYIIYMVMMGCASTQPGTTSTSGNSYAEDLSSLRPVFENSASTPKDQTQMPNRPVNTEPKFTVNESLHSILDSIDRINLSKKLIDGFSIQVYSGRREDALSCKRTLDQSLPELKAEMTYVEPNFRIRAGKYYTQLDAQKDFVAVKRYFPNAILIYNKFPIQ